MWGLHLKKKGRWWHYYRSVPKEFADVEQKRLISFSLKTGDFIEARRKAAEISAGLNQDWRAAKQRGVSLCSQDHSRRFQAACRFQQDNGFEPGEMSGFSDADFLKRLKFLILGEQPIPEQKAVLRMAKPPEFSMSGALDRFWDYIKDEWTGISHDQRRVKRNVYLKAIRNFEACVGTIPFQLVERSHAVQFRSWWVDRVQERKLKPYTANREINSLRRMFTVNYDIEGLSKVNPFKAVRLKDTSEVSRFRWKRIRLLLC